MEFNWNEEEPMRRASVNDHRTFNKQSWTPIALSVLPVEYFVDEFHKFPTRSHRWRLRLAGVLPCQIASLASGMRIRIVVRFPHRLKTY